MTKDERKNLVAGTPVMYIGPYQTAEFTPGKVYRVGGRYFYPPENWPEDVPVETCDIGRPNGSNIKNWEIATAYINEQKLKKALGLDNE